MKNKNEGTVLRLQQKIMYSVFCFILLRNLQTCEGDATYGWALVGYNDHVQGTTKEFAGVNLLGDYEFSMTINVDQLPNYYEMAMFAYDGTGA